VPNNNHRLDSEAADAALPAWRKESWRVAASYLIPLLVIALAQAGGFNHVVIMATALTVALTHWALPPISTTLFCIAIGHSIELANSEKTRINGDGILWQDIIYVLPNIQSNIGTTLQYIGYTGLAIGAGIAFCLALTLKLERKHLRRSLLLGLAFSIALTLLYTHSTGAYIDDVRQDLGRIADSPRAFAGQPQRSSVARFIHSISLPPADFQTNKTESSVFRHAADKLPGFVGAPTAGTPPDIFVLLNESQLDPMQLAACVGRNDCRLSLYEKGPHSVMYGPLRVHTHGWGTWNAEFTLMTGVPYHWFGENGFYSPYTVAPRVRLALAKHLSALGYRTIAVYPTQKGMLNAARAYRTYGIQDFFGAEDLGLSLDWCKIPDSLMYEKLMQRYRGAKADDNRPIFMVMLTIFNHGPHGEKCAAPELLAGLRNNASQETLKLEDYLQRSHASDTAAKQFRDTILESTEKALILFAGDHQPGFEGLHKAYPRKMHREMHTDEAFFFTGYQFFANYPILPRKDPEMPREMDIAFLGSTLLELAALPLGPLFLPNSELRDLCAGRLDQCPNGNLIDSYKTTLLENGFL